MTESKKKTPAKEVVEKDEDLVKPVKKAKVKEPKVKLVEKAIEEEVVPLIEEKEEKVSEVSEAPEEVVAEEKKERKPKKVKVEPEPMIEHPVPVANEDFDWERFEKDEAKDSPKHKEYEAMYDETL
ncbi:MAG: hypothetical protein ABSA76_10180, partial [Bacteroidales bacterium]